MNPPREAAATLYLCPGTPETRRYFIVAVSSLNSSQPFLNQTFSRPAQTAASAPAPSPKGPQDGLSLSPEALEEAAVDPEACRNDWRCLAQLQERGLLS